MVDLIKQAHKNAIKRGYYGKCAKQDVYYKLREEIGEFYFSEPHDTFNKDSEQSEIADIIIILLAYSGEMGYNIEQAIQDKLDYNDSRGDHG